MRKHNVMTRLGGRRREPDAAQRAMRLMVVGLLVLPQSVVPAVIMVTGTDSTVDANDGVCSLREAINNANDNTVTSMIVGECVAGDDATAGGDTITLTANVTLTVVDNSSYYGRGLPVIFTDVTIGGGFTIARDTGAGTPIFGIFAVSPSGTLSLVDITVSGGNARFGGGIYNRFGTTTLTNSTVSGNDASSAGGGIYSYYGTTTLTNSTVSGNDAGDGGGISNFDGTTTLTNSTVSGNSAYRGGGIHNRFGTITLTNSTVSRNDVAYAFGYGGGIFTSGNGATTTLTNSTVSGNDAVYGGGIMSYGYGTTTLTNSTVSGNDASFGGGINSYYYGTTTLTNSTVSGNSAASRGGGIMSYYYGTTTLTNSIVANSLAGGDCRGGGFIDGFNNFSEDGSCPGITITPMVDFDTTLANNGGPTETHALLAGSVAIDAAGNCALLDPVVLLTDQRGVPRSDGSCDSGSYEFVPVSDDDSSDDDSSDDDSSDDDSSDDDSS